MQAFLHLLPSILLIVIILRFVKATCYMSSILILLLAIPNVYVIDHVICNVIRDGCDSHPLDLVGYFMMWLLIVLGSSFLHFGFKIFGNRKGKLDES